MRWRLYGVISAGLIGTMAMATVLYTVPSLLFAPEIDIPMLLGTFIADGNLALALGSIVFIGVGLTAAAGYAGLWLIGIGRPSLPTGLLFGFGQGLVAIAALQILYALNPTPPPIYMTGVKSFAVLLGHLAFGALVAVIYRPFAERAAGKRFE